MVAKGYQKPFLFDKAGIDSSGHSRCVVVSVMIRRIQKGSEKKQCVDWHIPRAILRDHKYCAY